MVPRMQLGIEISKLNPVERRVTPRLEISPCSPVSSYRLAFHSTLCYAWIQFWISNFITFYLGIVYSFFYHLDFWYATHGLQFFLLTRIPIIFSHLYLVFQHLGPPLGRTFCPYATAWILLYGRFIFLPPWNNG